MARVQSVKSRVAAQEALLQDRDFLRDLVQPVLQELLEAEFTHFLGARPHERTTRRRGYRNGSYDRVVLTRVGKISLRVPRDRAGQFSTELFSNYQRSEQALLLGLLEMYVQGVSTRNVGKVSEVLFGASVSKDVVSRLTAGLDEVVEAWRHRPVGRHYPYVYHDGTYHKVRQEGRVVSMATLLVLGINPQGGRELLATAVVHGENEADYAGLLQDLRQRGMEQVDLFISDDHAGLRHVVEWVATWDGSLADWLDELTPELVAHMEFPRHHWRKIRSTNMLERVNEELRRRVRVLRIFPNRASCLRLVTMLAIEQDEDWQSDAHYVSMPQMKGSKEEAWRKVG